MDGVPGVRILKNLNLKKSEKISLKMFQIPGMSLNFQLPGVPGVDAEDAKAQTQQFDGCFTCPQG